MMLEDLQLSLKDMSDEELEELLKEIRHNRTTENVIKKKEVKKKKEKNELEALLSKLSPDQLAALLAST